MASGKDSGGAARAWARLRTPNPVDPTTEALRLPELEERDAYRTLNLAMRIGELLLSGGAGAGDVTSTIRAVTRAAGLAHCEADVTYTSISISYLRSVDSAPITGSRFVRRTGFDGTRISEVHELVDELVRGRLTVAAAQERIDLIRKAPHPYPRWVATVSFAGLAAAVAVLLGGGLLVIATAFVATAVIDRANRWLNARQVPFFYQYVLGGAVATTAAVLLAAAELEVNSSLVVASGIVVLIPGGLLVGGVQDAIGGFLVTASARILEVFVLTAGLLTGVAMALDVGGRFGVVIEVGEVSSEITRLPVRALAAAAVAGLFALANYSPRRVVLSSALVGGLGFALLDGLIAAGVSSATATAGAAIAMGVVAHALAGRVRIAPLLLLVPAIIPQLPGLTLFRALLGLSSGHPTVGYTLLLSALAVGFALAAGVIFGELLAQPVRREGSRFERRMGPRLIGPLRRRDAPAPGRDLS